MLQKQLAVEAKDSGNAHFKDQRYEPAIEEYSRAIELDSSDPAYFSNRAFAYLKTEAYGYALADAEKALELDSTFTKAYYRKATALTALQRFPEALSCLKIVIKNAPNDPMARSRYASCLKIVQAAQFADAIAFEDTSKRSRFADLKLHLIEVDASSYKGPHLQFENVVCPVSRVTRKQIPESFILELVSCFKAQGSLHKKYVYMILEEVYVRFKACEALVDLPLSGQPPLEGGERRKITVCGDVHGQVYDLFRIFELNGYPSKANQYLFNGDFVDRGSFSLEVILLLFALKLAYPDDLWLSRGNHETTSMNKMYGFDGEVKSKGNQFMLDLFREVFQTLPLAYVIDDRVFVCHGGLFSRDGVTLDEIRKLNRFCEPPNEGLMCELLWSDPCTAAGRHPSKRGIAIQYGPDVTEDFLNTNGLKYMIRSHEMCQEGYASMHDGKCITVFSAPNYCDQGNNKGAFITLYENEDCEPHYTTFEAAPHPDIKPMAYSSNYSAMGL